MKKMLLFLLSAAALFALCVIGITGNPAETDALEEPVQAEPVQAEPVQAEPVADPVEYFLPPMISM